MKKMIAKQHREWEIKCGKMSLINRKKYTLSLLNSKQLKKWSIEKVNATLKD